MSAPILYLTFCGVLHDSRVLWRSEDYAPISQLKGDPLFCHGRLLEELIAPLPELKIVLTTPWLDRFGLKDTAWWLPRSMQSRVVGMTGVRCASLPRGQQIATDLTWRQPPAWFAIDHDDEGFDPDMRKNFVKTHQEHAIGGPGIADQIRAHIERLKALEPA